MADNGISTLGTKQLKQVAKLNLAQTRRQTVGTEFRTHNIYDITRLPTQYLNDAVVDNPNVGGLMATRPWHE